MRFPVYWVGVVLCFALLGYPRLSAANDTANGGSVGYLGVQVEPAGSGLRVTGVMPDSPAARSGIMVGDVIVSARGAPPGSVDAFVTSVRAAGPGVVYPLRVLRGRQVLAIDVPLGAAPRMGVTLGAPAPALSAQLVMGPGPADLSQLRGRVVLIDFWASWCGPCLAAMPMLNRLHQRFGAQGLTVLGVTDEGAATVRRIGAQLSIGYTLATEPTAAVRFGVRSLPTLVVVDRRGMVRRVSVGLDTEEMQRLDRLVRRLLAEPGP